MKLKIGMIAMLASLMLVGCSTETVVREENISNENKVEENIESKNSEVEENTDNESKESIEYESKENNIQEDQTEENQAQENQTQEKKENDNLQSDKSENLEFKIYTANEDDTEKIVEFKTINLEKDSSIEEKLKELQLALKKDYFKDDQANIYLDSIDSNNIATINLVGEQAWSKHFQGSTGGIISQSTIIETLLQREYEGDWIKGINVLIDGKKQEVFDHASFEEIFYR